MAEWSDYRYFLALARAGTLAGAARALGVEHTTVSRRIAALEASLDTKLFIRTPDGFVPTAAGADALALVEQAAQALEAVERRVEGEDTACKGTVKLTTSEGMAPYVIKVLVELRDRHPDILVEVLATNAVVDLTRREADLAVRVAPTPQAELLIRKIAEVGWGVYADEGYLTRAGTPASPGDLAGHDVIAYDEARAVYPGAKWIDAHSAGARIVMRGSSMIAVLNAATMGMGIAVVPCFLGEREPRLRRIGKESIGARDLCLVVHPDLARVARIRAVMDFLIEVANRDVAILGG